MEFQSQTADTERVITLPGKDDDAILSGPWLQYMAKCSVRGARGFVLAGYPVNRPEHELGRRNDMGLTISSALAN